LLSKRRTKRDFSSLFASALFFLVLLAGARGFAWPSCLNCNVILISLDTVAAARLGVYGGSSKVSPSIDAFAASARTYKSAYSTSAWTLPAHAAMLTGFFPWRLGVNGEVDPLPHDTPLLAERLKAAGYLTGARSSGYYVTRHHGFHRGFDSFVKNEDRKKWRDGAWIVDQATSFLNLNRQKKFFLFLHSFHAHAPFTPTEKARESVDSGYKGKIQSMPSKDLIRLTVGKDVATVEDQDRIRALYDAGINELDSELARLFKSIKDLGLDRNTVVVITSDHGEGLGGHGLWGYHAVNVYDELVRVPLIVKAPQVAAKTIESPVSLIDIVPTLLSILKIAPGTSFDGVVLPDEDDASSASRSVFAATSVSPDVLSHWAASAEKPRPSKQGPPYIRTTPGRRLGVSEQMVRSGSHKLILKFDRSFELYDLSKDPGEIKNIYSEPSKIGEHLKSLLLGGKSSLGTSQD